MSTRVSITPGCFQKSRKVGVSLSTDQVQLKFCMLLELLPHASKHQLFLHMYICVHMHTHSSKISESLLVVERKRKREREVDTGQESKCFLFIFASLSALSGLGFPCTEEKGKRPLEIIKESEEKTVCKVLDSSLRTSPGHCSAV